MPRVTRSMSKFGAAPSSQTTQQSLLHQIFQLPETLFIIFSCLTEIDLYRSALVCVQWKAIAIELLWKHYTPPIHRLHEMHEKSTLAKYIPLMREMRVNCKDCNRRDYEGGPCRMVKAHEFVKEIGKTLYPQLKVFSLTVNTWFKYATPNYLDGLIQPCLRKLTVREVDAVYAMLGLLNEKTPNLEVIDMRPLGKGAAMDDLHFHSFICSNPQLQKITNLLSCISNSTFMTLAKLPSLDTLGIDSFKSTDWSDFVLNSTQDVSALFPALRSLDIRGWGHGTIDETGVARLISCGMFANLEALKVYYYGVGIIPVLQNCPMLRSVKLRFFTPEEVCQQKDVEEGLEAQRGAYMKPQHDSILDDLDPHCMFDFFRACQRLSKFTIGFNGFRVVSSSDLCCAFKLLPHVRTLRLPWSCSIGEPELRTLKKCCPRMANLDLADSVLRYEEIHGHALQVV